MEKNEVTIKDLTERVESMSTNFEKNNTELKKRYLIWNIDSFNKIASRVSVWKGTFGTGYPFYALDENLEGNLPIISEQVRYNRQLVRDGKPVQKSIWLCKECLDKKYKDMPDLKKICRPCPNMIDSLKPRKIINRLPDVDMWLICKDGCVEQAQDELVFLMKEINWNTSDRAPMSTLDDIEQISKMISEGKFPKIFLPIDMHIMEYSTMKKLIEDVPDVLKKSEETGIVPYLPIQPKSYRKCWQYDDEAYNYIFDFLASFTPFNFSNELQESLSKSRKTVASCFSRDELFDLLMKAASKSAFKRFQQVELEEYFLNKMDKWSKIDDRKFDDDQR